MKFTPESLIEIYMNGSFTEEAQAEFDALMRADASFAERVTQSVAERLGPVPDGVVDPISGRLDSKMDGLWSAHKPSPWGGLLKISVKAALLLAAAGGIVGAYEHFWAPQEPSSKLEQGISSGVGILSPPHQLGSVSKKSPNNPSVLSTERKAGSSASSPGGAPGQTVSLSFKEIRAASGPDFSTSAPSGLSQAHPALNVNRGSGAESPAGSAPTNPQASMASPPLSAEGDALRVSIEMEKTGKVIITVLDSNGLLVRGLYQGFWNQGIHLLDWDGKDEAGNQVQPGNYTVAVNANGKTMSGTLRIRSDR